MAIPTEFLMEKINHLKGQLQSDKMQIWVNDLAIQDAVEPTSNKNVDQQLKANADSVLATNTMLMRRVETRQAILDQLQKEWDDQQKPA